MPPIDIVKRLNTWLRKSLQITEKTTLPGTITGEIRPIIDAMGWDLLQFAEVAGRVTAGATTSTRLTVVPPGEAHYFLGCDITHDDGGAHTILIAYRSASGNETTIGPVDAVAAYNAQVPAVLSRPILVLPGDGLVGNSLDSIPIGSDFTIRGHFIRLELGQYVPGSPYG